MTVSNKNVWVEYALYKHSARAVLINHNKQNSVNDLFHTIQFMCVGICDSSNDTYMIFWWRICKNVAWVNTYQTYILLKNS